MLGTMNKSPMPPSPSGLDSSSLLQAMIGDGVPLILLTALALAASGGFALFLSITGSFLPHDIEFLGMQAADLCRINECRIVHFMIHDRFSFGGVLIAIAVLYAWLALFPLRQGEAWAWRLLLASGVVGFGSFLSYIGYGYLDTWHGVASLFLLPIFTIGMLTTRNLVTHWPPWSAIFVSVWRPVPSTSREGIGRLCLLVTGVGMLGAGTVILIVGMTSVFVPEDLQFMGLTPAQLEAVNPRLIPLIAHDRAGFGGGLLTTGLMVTVILWQARPSQSMWEALLIAGAVGFGCAIGVHYPIGYRDAFHLAPGWMGLGIFLTGIWLSRPRCVQTGANAAS